MTTGCTRGHFYLKNLRFFDFSGLEAFCADVSGDGRALLVDDMQSLDIGLEQTFGPSCDLASGTALGPGHTSSGYVAANDLVF